MQTEIDTDFKLHTDGQIERLRTEALHEMLHYHERGGKQRIKEAVKKAAGRYVPPEDMIFWPTGLLANMLAGNYHAWEEKEEVLAALKTYFDRWMEKGMPVYSVDNILCGEALIDLYRITGEEKYKAGITTMVRYLYDWKEQTADGEGNLPYRPKQKNFHIYVDGIGMICPFLCRYGAEFQDEAAVELAVLQMKNMLKYGMDGKTALPYHGFQYESRIKYGIIGWGRAVGWCMTGLSGMLACLPRGHADYPYLKAEFGRLFDSAASYQKENGAFAWQLEALEGPEDSSATAMIAQAVSLSLGAGFAEKEEAAQRLIKRAAAFIRECEKDGRIYKCSGECMGFSQYPQVYGAYPWSLGPGLEVLLKEKEL